jgi:hypothetical protein
MVITLRDTAIFNTLLLLLLLLGQEITQLQCKYIFQQDLSKKNKKK